MEPTDASPPLGRVTPSPLPMWQQATTPMCILKEIVFLPSQVRCSNFLEVSEFKSLIFSLGCFGWDIHLTSSNTPAHPTGGSFPKPYARNWVTKALRSSPNSFRPFNIKSTDLIHFSSRAERAFSFKKVGKPSIWGRNMRAIANLGKHRVTPT